jgi:hypothetical protein
MYINLVTLAAGSKIVQKKTPYHALRWLRGDARYALLSLCPLPLVCLPAPRNAYAFFLEGFLVVLFAPLQHRMLYEPHQMNLHRMP